MKKTVSALCLLTLLLAACQPSQNSTDPTKEIVERAAEEINPNILQLSAKSDPELATRFTRLALDCVHREYPNKISRTMDSDAEVGPPRELFPVFYGCFDWHSSVHGHWLLIRQLRLGNPSDAWHAEAIVKLDLSFTDENIAGEVAQFARPARGSWERPYGLAWFLQLTAELREWDDPQAKIWLKRLEPLERDIADSLNTWLPKLAYPIRLGTHNQSAFAFGLMLDWARVAGDTEMERLIIERSKKFHIDDKNCPLAYEPSGEDFLSPCLMEADLMRRVLGPSEFSDWLTEFMPNIPTDGSGDWLAPGIVTDASDGKLVHLDGVNLSRAWNLYNVARALPEDDPRRLALAHSAKLHQDVGIAAVSDEHYSGSHWLASFATYLVTDRGWNP